MNSSENFQLSQKKIIITEKNACTQGLALDGIPPTLELVFRFQVVACRAEHTLKFYSSADKSSWETGVQESQESQESQDSQEIEKRFLLFT